MKMSILMVTGLCIVTLQSCRESQPTRAVIIKEVNRRGMNVVDGAGFEASRKAEEELVALLKKVPRQHGDFEYRRLGILGDSKRLSIVAFGVDRRNQDVKKSIEKILKRHQLDKIELVDERIVEEDGKSYLIYDALEYAIVDGKLVSKEIRKIDPGLIGELSK